MEMRQNFRYNLEVKEGEKSDIGPMQCSFDFDRSLRADIVDISLSGMGLEMRSITPAQAEAVKNLESFMLTMTLGKDSMLTGVKKAWNMVSLDNESMIYRCGVSIDVISPEDRLKLAGIIRTIRNSR
jgi:c-di-GMP-binding flagellar brake protein YcgR